MKKLVAECCKVINYFTKFSEREKARLKENRPFNPLNVTTVSVDAAVLLIIVGAIFYIRKIARKEKKMEAKVEALSHDK